MGNRTGVLWYGVMDRISNRENMATVRLIVMGGNRVVSGMQMQVGCFSGCVGVHAANLLMYRLYFDGSMVVNRERSILIHNNDSCDLP